jgi:hypothetical protein
LQYHHPRRDHPSSGHYWQQTISGDVRAVGAYIAKPKQYPRAEDYAGRIYGTAGTLWEILATQREAPVVAAAALQYALNSHAMLEAAAFAALTQSQRNEWKWAAQARREAEKKTMTQDQARAIAARWLPDLLEFKEKNRQRSELEIMRIKMKQESEI